MPIQFRCLSGSIAAALFAASTLAAQADVLVGTPATPGIGNCIPFGCFRNYQQVYSSSLFSGPISIIGLTFFNTQFTPGTIDPATYTITLSSGGATVGSLSTTFANNLGPNAQLFFSGSLSGSAAPSFTISGTAFNYNPSSGDLLVQIFKNTGTSNAAATVFADSRTGDFSDFERVFNTDGSATGFVQTARGLVTQFDTPPVSAVPLPAALPLFATGLAGLGLLGWRRKKKALAA